jgi:hypothetical protein
VCRVQMRANMSSYLKSLSPEDMANIQRQKAEYAKSSSSDRSRSSATPSSVRPAPGGGGGGVQLQDLSEAQLDELVQAILSNPEYARNMLRSQSGLGYMSSEQIDKQINMLRQLDKATMKATIQAAVRMQKLCQPLIHVYNRCDVVTSGYAKYIFGVLAIVICIVLAYCLWHMLHFVVSWVLRAMNIYLYREKEEPKPAESPLDLSSFLGNSDGDIRPAVSQFMGSTANSAEASPPASGRKRFPGEDEFEF